MISRLLRNMADLAAHLGVPLDSPRLYEGVYRALYHATECGVWARYDEHHKIECGINPVPYRVTLRRGIGSIRVRKVYRRSRRIPLIQDWPPELVQFFMLDPKLLAQNDPRGTRLDLAPDEVADLWQNLHKSPQVQKVTTHWGLEKIVTVTVGERLVRYAPALELGSIIEGSDATVGPYTLEFPFTVSALHLMLDSIDAEAREHYQAQAAEEKGGQNDVVH